MRLRNLTKAACAAALAAACCLGLAACAAESSAAVPNDPVLDTADVSGGVAATVNGVEIGENAVTAYIAGFRAAQGLEADDAWGAWLIDCGYTVDSVRGDTLDLYVNQELVRQAAVQNDVAVERSAVDEQVQAARGTVESDEDWQAALAQMGMSEEAYRANVELTLLQQALMDKVAPDASATDEEVLACVKAYESDYAEAASLADVPEETVASYRAWADSAAKQKAFSEWMADFKDGADIEKNYLPDGLPYAIDLTPYEEAARAAAQEVQSGQADATSDAA